MSSFRLLSKREMLKNWSVSRAGVLRCPGNRGIVYDKRLREQKGKFLLYIRKKTYDYESAPTLAQVAQKCEATFTPKLFKNLTGEGNEKHYLTWKLALL